MDAMQSFQDFLTTQIPRINLGTFAIDLTLTMTLILILGQVYNRYGSAMSNRKEFSRNLVIVGMTTMIIITIVKSSLALSLGLVGALSIVRFRTPIKEPEELAYLFLSIAIGLGLGAGQRAVVAIGFGFVAAVIWYFSLRRTAFEEEGMHVSISTTQPAPNLLEDIISALSEHSTFARLRRLDETSDSFQGDFSVAFDDFEQLKKMKQAIRSIDGDLEVSFLDNRIG